MLDIYSRYAVGWLLDDHESADLAQQLIADELLKTTDCGVTVNAPCRPGAPMTPNRWPNS